SLVCCFSKRQVLQIHSSTSFHSLLRAVTRQTSSPPYHNCTFPLHVGQSRWASTGFKNHTRFLNRKVLSVKAPTGQTSMMFPMNSLSKAFPKYVEISAWSPRNITPCSRQPVIWSAVFTQR